jgi:hypothetical protein
VGPSENYNDETGGELRKDEGNDIIGESESISISVLDEKNHSMVIPWSRLLKKTTLGGFGCERDVGEIHCELRFILDSTLQKP